MTRDPSTLRLGLIGLGNIGHHHAGSIFSGKTPEITLTAAAEASANRREAFAQAHPEVETFPDLTSMASSGLVDAVLIGTPHFSHTALGIEALEAGLHVLVEKPISVHKADCERLIEAWKDRSLVFAAMFNQRTDPLYLKIRELIHSGELGALHRIQWTVTDWFRSEAYYRSGDWRATWAGEGGGVLLNQCPHQLDLWYWLFGMPNRVRAVCKLGRYHDIEVEDQVTAMLEYDDGATGVFVTSTGEAPGANRLEIAAERGLLVAEHGKLRYLRNEVEITAYSRTTDQRFGRPPHWDVQIPVASGGPQHIGILNNFAAACLHGEELIAPAVEGIFSVELGNAMLFSGLKDQTVELPLDSTHFETLLKELMSGSRWQPHS